VLSFLDTRVGYLSTLRQRLTKSSPIAGSFRVLIRAQNVATPREIEASKRGTAAVAKA
jgi:hypothetical protein